MLLSRTNVAVNLDIFLISKYLYFDGPNHYAYVRNNPLKYIDRDGRFVWVIPFMAVSFGAAGYTATCITAEALLGALIGGALGVIVYQGAQKLDQAANTEPVESTDKKKKNQKHSPDQQAISDLVKDSGKNGISNSDADTLLDWSNEYDFPHRDDRGKDHWIGGEHIHIGPRHVPVKG